MAHSGIVRTALRRGALVVAANWPVVAIQAVGDSAFKLLLAIPILGVALLVTLLVGDGLADVLARDRRETLATVAQALLARPAALGGFLLACLLVALGGSILMFLIKGGTVSVLIGGERHAGPIEHPPLRLAGFERAMHFSVERFSTSSARLFRRYCRLGFLLIGIYVCSAALYALMLYAAFRMMGAGAPLIGWTFAAALLAVGLVVWTTIVNLLYLLTQVVVAVTDGGVASSAREVLRFLRADSRHVVGIFVVILLLVVLVTGLSLAATAALGLIAFVPLAGVAVLPLQLIAWLLRNLVFQYLGLTALTAYLVRYRAITSRPDGVQPESSVGNGGPMSECPP
jgi:hypothetical protein